MEGSAVIVQTLTLAIFLGVAAQIVSERLRIPSILPLLFLGIGFGPYGLGVLHVDKMEGMTATFISLGVAVILFEGGMCLNFKSLALAPKAIVSICTTGALVTLVGSTTAIYFILDANIWLCLLTGSILTVTGPTVIGPLLRRIRVDKKISDLLMYEGILVDSLGAILAVMILQVILSGSDIWKLSTLGGFVGRFAVGLVIGYYTGLFLVYVLKNKLVGEDLRNLVILAMVLFTYWVSNTLMSSSGLLTVTVTGLVLAQIIEHPSIEEAKKFKDQLAILILSVLFILLAARLDVSDIFNYGWKLPLAVASIIMVVRPLNIFISTFGTELSLREKLFLCWIAPRGIVAASTASLFVIMLQHSSFSDQNPKLMESIIFLIVLATVLLQGLSAGFVARFLKVEAKPKEGFLIVGVHEFSLSLAEKLKESNISVQFIDSIEWKVEQALQAGFNAFCGNALDEGEISHALSDDTGRMLCLTENDEVNTVACGLGEKMFGKQNAWQTVNSFDSQITDNFLYKYDRKAAFDLKVSMCTLNEKLKEGSLRVERLHLEKTDQGYEYPPELIFPLFLLKGTCAKMMDDTTTVDSPDIIAVVSA